MNDEVVENVVDEGNHTTETEQTEVDLLAAVEDSNEVVDADAGTKAVETVETDLEAEAAAEAGDAAEAAGEPVEAAEPVEKKIFHKIYLNKEGKEYKRVPRGQGRVPADATRDADNNTVIPWHEPKVAKPKPVETETPAETPVVAETPAPPVEVVEPVGTAEPADQI